MGTEGVKKPMKELVGSLTYHIIEKSEIPVLAIPNSTGYKPIDLIGYGVDYERVYDTRSLSVLKDFAYSFKSRLEIFHIRKYGDASRFLEPHEKAKLDGYFKGLTHEFEIIESDSIPDGLYEYVRKSNPSLVVLVPRKYPFFEWLDHESLSEEAVQHLKIPVLTIPE